MTLVGIDPGSVRIGIAFAQDTPTQDTTTLDTTAQRTSTQHATAPRTMGIATPHGVVSRKDPNWLAQLCTLLHKQDTHTLVMGLPLRLDGTSGSSATRARKMANAIQEYMQEQYKRTVHLEFVDERLTTRQAQDYLQPEKGKRTHRSKKTKPPVDAVAASILLQTYLDSL